MLHWSTRRRPLAEAYFGLNLAGGSAGAGLLGAPETGGASLVPAAVGVAVGNYLVIHGGIAIAAGSHVLMATSGSKGGGDASKPAPGNTGNDIPFTREMSARSQVIAKGGEIDKIEQLKSRWGGRTTDWAKKKTWDAAGREIHYYEGPNGMKAGKKLAGQLDPF